MQKVRGTYAGCKVDPNTGLPVASSGGGKSRLKLHPQILGHVGHTAERRHRLHRGVRREGQHVARHVGRRQDGRLLRYRDRQHWRQVGRRTTTGLDLFFIATAATATGGGGRRVAVNFEGRPHLVA